MEKSVPPIGKLPNERASMPGHFAEPTNERHGPAFQRSCGALPTFASIYANYFRFVWCAVRNWGVEPGEVDDVVQDVFIAISDRLHTIERPESLRSWIYGVVRRVSSAYRRTKHARLVKTAILATEDKILAEASTTPEQLTEQSEKVKLLWRLLDQLDPPKREVFVLAELNEMTVPEISEAIGVPLNTVYSRLRMARRDLEQILERQRARKKNAGARVETEFGIQSLGG